MKKNFITKPVFAIFLIILAPFILAPTTTTIKKARPPAQPALQGYVKKSPTEGLQYVRVRSITDGYETCSQSSGWYSFQLLAGGNKNVTYVKQGFKMALVPVNSLEENETRQLDNVTLANPDSTKEISGYVGIAKEGITVKLIQIGCTDAEIARTKTCIDGKYSFYGIRDPETNTVIDLSAGTYRVEPCCSVCPSFTPTFSGNIQIPITPGTTYDFTTTCTDGACQPCP
jgi:hypothetical protein